MKNELKESLDTEEIIKKISVADKKYNHGKWTFGYGI